VPRKWPDNDKEIVILLIEDEKLALAQLMPDIQRLWSPQSKGVRSAAGAEAVLQDQRFDPHLVIHDCRPLRREEHDNADRKAGDELYCYLVIRGFRVVVMSGLDQTAMDEAPYRSDPPLAFIEKPATIEKIHEAVEVAKRKSP
jgi:hypothetical protein